MLRFVDGFDFYVSADLLLRWGTYGTNFGSPSVQSATTRFGSGGALSNTDSGGNLQKQFDNQATWIIGMAVRFSTVSNSSASPGQSFVSFRDGTTTQVDLRITSGGLLVVTRNGTAIGTGTTVLASGVWYYIEFKATIAASISAHTCVVRIGGVTEIDVAAGTSTKASANSYANVLKMDGFGPGVTVDDLYFCDGTGAVNNDFLGDVRVELTKPSADGTLTDWTPNTGTRFAAVNGTNQDGDTTYISSNTLNQRDTFAFAALSSSPATVFGIQTTLVARKDDAGSRQVANLLRSGGTDYLGATITLPDSYAYLSEIRETNPATSAAFTASDLSSMEAGVKLVG